MIPILYVQPYASNVGGVDSVLLQLIAGLDRSRFRPIVVLPGPSAYVERYEALGCKVLFAPIAVFGKPTDPLYYFRNAAKLVRSTLAIRRIAKAHGVRLIHSHKMETLGPNAAGKSLGIPTVQTVHELPRKPLFAYKAVAWLNHRLNDKVIVLCDRSRVMFRWGSRESAKLVKIYNGIADRPRTREPGESLREKLGLSPEDKLAITVARLSPMKGIEYLLDAAERLRGTDRSIKFAVAGDIAFESERAYKENLLRQIEERGLGDTVFMLGLRRDVGQLLEQSDALVLPSVYDIFPTVILEAMSERLPVVATDVGGVPEMVRPDTGRLVPARDGQALAEALVRLFADDPRAAGERGYELYRREFTRERYVARTVELYEELLAAAERPEQAGVQAV